MSKYGFSKPTDKSSTDLDALTLAARAGEGLGFVSREPDTRLKPGPKRTELQSKVSIPGPKRVVDRFRTYCRNEGLTLWQGLERLLDKAS